MPDWVAALQVLPDVLAALAWPGAVTVIAWWLRPELRALIDRLRKASVAGLDFDPRQQRKADTPPEPGLRSLPSLPTTPAIEAVERKLEEQLESIPAESRQATLVRVLAQSQLSTVFERVYGVIYGSQIAGLRELNSRDAVSVDQAKDFFNRMIAEKGISAAAITFEAWLRFLVNWGLVKNEDDHVSITDMGRDFLAYLIAMRLPQDRPL